MVEERHAGAISTTVQHLAARWQGADKGLLRRVFPLLTEGQPVPVERIADITGAPPARIEDALGRARAGRDSRGRVTELSGLTLDPTLHRVEIEGVALFSCCALLAHLTPILLQRAVRLESVDPQTRSLVRLELTPEKIAAWEPATAVGSFVVTEPQDLAADVGANFCTHVHHFSDRSSAVAYLARDPRRYRVELQQLRNAAEELYQRAWS